MNKTTSRIVALIVVVGLGIGLFIALDNNEPVTQNENTESQQTQTEENEATNTNETEETTSEETATVVVTYTNDGFSPEEIGPITPGETVRFENQSTRSMWVASDEHPAHTDNPDFDQLRGVGAGESYSYTFEMPGEYDFHNHLVPSDGGTVIVE